MKARNEIVTAKSGAQVEIGTIELGGREFSALGSVIDESSGVIVGYPTLPDDRGYVLTTWDGKTIGKLTITGYARGFHRTPLTCWALTHNGRRYHGRNAGTLMVLRLRTGR
jgi:hypothetical protein